MRNIKDEHNLNKKKVLLRLDLNVPLSNGQITDTTRIDKILPTINFLLKNNAQIIILSHIGRPKGKIINELSLKPVCESLKNKLNQDIRLISKNIIFEITKFIPSYAGLQLNLEIDALTKITSEIKKPITCIIGGSKISTKINIIKNLIPKFDNIIIVGGMANNILKFKGYNIGKSIQEDDCDKIIEEIFSLSVKKNCKIIYPEDVTVGKDLNGSPEIKELNNVSEDELILDIGPKSIKSINKIIEESNTILWNGPAGYFENPNFAKGSLEIMKKIIEKNKANTIYSVAGGGDTVALLNSVGAVNNFDFVSTAGGAFLEYLEGKELPGIKALN